MLDVETETITKLVTDTVLGGHISSRLPDDFESKLPYGTLRRAPGSRYVDTNTKRLEVVRLQANTYAAIDDDVAAFDAMTDLVDALLALEGSTIGSMFVTAVDVPQTADWAPDPESARPGYRGFVTIYAHG